MAAQLTTAVSDETKPISPAKFAHAVLRTTRFKEMTDWYRTVLGAKVMYENKFLAFMTYDDEHHRIAIAAFPGIAERQPHSAGLDHLAYTYASIDDLVATYERLKVAGILPVVTINHGITTSMYYHDPDRNQVELLVDNFATAAEGQAYMRQRSVDDKNPVGIVYDPEELVGRVRDGLRIEELASIN